MYNSGKHGKVCTEESLGKLDWYSAMKQCQNLNGYSDWYLPNKAELELIHYLKFEFISELENIDCWSSEEFDYNKAYYYNHIFGFSGKKEAKTNIHSVRAVRVF